MKSEKAFVFLTFLIATVQMSIQCETQKEFKLE